MKAVTGSSGASYQQGNPGLSMKCSNSSTAAIFCANSPAQAASTSRRALHPVASTGGPLGATPAGGALGWAELSQAGSWGRAKGGAGPPRSDKPRDPPTAPRLHHIGVAPWHKSCLMCDTAQRREKPNRTMKSLATFLGLHEARRQLLLLYLSSLSQKKVINNFPGDNFICVFILKYRELS